MVELLFQKFFSVNYGWKYVKKCENILISLQNRQFLESFQRKVLPERGWWRAVIAL